MPDYQTMYHKLFNKVTDIIEELQSIQIQTEEMHSTSDAPEIHMRDEILNDDSAKNNDSKKTSRR